MEKLNCLVIEDQIPAQEILRDYIEKVPTLHLSNVFISPLDAIPILESDTIDILLLDIHLPKLSGIELMKSLNNLPPTILTTAFSDYAVEGFNLDVVDYLLKPFSFDRFLKAVSKVPTNEGSLTKDEKSDQIFVRNKGQIIKIKTSTIDYVEAKGDFIIISHDNNREIANISLNKLLNILNSNFIRCHKSYIVNLNSIEKIIGNNIILKTKEIPVGRSFKLNLMNRLKMI